MVLDLDNFIFARGKLRVVFISLEGLVLIAMNLLLRPEEHPFFPERDDGNWCVFRH